MSHPRTALAAIAALLVASAAQAGSPASVAPDATARERAEASFDRFARDFMERARERNASVRESPRAQRSADALVFTYRTIGDDFEVELQPTGRAAAPFVGVLHYTEHTHVCQDAAGERCRVASSVPVSEIFRYRGGRWSY